MAWSLDQNLRPHATDRQWELLEAWERHGSQRRAAEALGLHNSSIDRAFKAVRNKAARQGYSPDHDMTRTVPDGFRVRGVSTYYDMDGNPRGQWVKSAEDRERQLELMREAIAALTQDLPRIEPVQAPEQTAEHLLAVYPVGDHHLGMLSWHEETGADYDLEIGERLLAQARDYLISAAPSCEQALIAFMGDFMHYDSYEAVTPTSRNTLDADGRFPKMVRVAIRSMRRMVDQALGHHARVHVIVEIGNHDLASSVFLRECLSQLYEKEPRLTVDTSPTHFHYYRFGKNLLGTHHGHGVKMQDLPLIMAHDRAAEWGQTEHRHIFTGHIHHKQKFNPTVDMAGVTVESLKVMPPSDAHHANKGYRPKRGMEAIVFHQEHGEVSRHTVNPGMLAA